jgi:hypothetical protein
MQLMPASIPASRNLFKALTRDSGVGDLGSSFRASSRFNVMSER